LDTEKDVKKCGFLLFIGGAVFTAVIILWPIFMVLSQTEGEIGEQLTAISFQPEMYKLNFFIASLIAPAMALILVMLAFKVETRMKTPKLNTLGAVLIVPYAVLVSFAYISQYTLLQGFLNDGDWLQAELWYFNNAASVPYFINQLGYAFFGFSGMLIGFKFLKEKGILRAIGVLLWLSGILSFAAFGGLMLGSELMNFSTIISGLLTLPIGILVMSWGLHLGRREGSYG